MSLDGRDAVIAAYDDLDAAVDRVLGLSYDGLSYSEQHLRSRIGWSAIRAAPGLSSTGCCPRCRRWSPRCWAARRWPKCWHLRLRISKKDARRRIARGAGAGAADGADRRPAGAGAAAHAPPPSAAARSAAEHVKIIRPFFANLPDFVDYATREAAEAAPGPARLRIGARRSCGRPPTGLAHAARPRRRSCPDAEQARRRYLIIGKQGSDGMSEFARPARSRGPRDAGCGVGQVGGTGHVQPRRRHPMCRRRTRRPRHRRAICGRRASATTTRSSAMGRSDAGLGTAGQPQRTSGHHHRLHHAQRVGIRRWACRHRRRVTASRCADLIRQASHAHHYLASSTTTPRSRSTSAASKRLASPGQRIVLLRARPRLHPPRLYRTGLSVSGPPRRRLGCQRRPTNITRRNLACAADNRLIKHGGWTTRKRHDGRTEWIPPPHLDTGQARVNNYHHPERYLIHRRRRQRRRFR